MQQIWIALTGSIRHEPYTKHLVLAGRVRIASTHAFLIADSLRVGHHQDTGGDAHVEIPSHARLGDVVVEASTLHLHGGNHLSSLKARPSLYGAVSWHLETEVAGTIDSLKSFDLSFHGGVIHVRSIDRASYFESDADQHRFLASVHPHLSGDEGTTASRG